MNCIYPKKKGPKLRLSRKSEIESTDENSLCVCFYKKTRTFVFVCVCVCVCVFIFCACISCQCFFFCLCYTKKPKIPSTDLLKEPRILFFLWTGLLLYVCLLCVFFTWCVCFTKKSAKFCKQTLLTECRIRFVVCVGLRWCLYIFVCACTLVFFVN